ncbi:MAG: CopG family transcriptional regulator [Steroidobacteraceae bacterium]
MPPAPSLRPRPFPRQGNFEVRRILAVLVRDSVRDAEVVEHGGRNDLAAQLAPNWCKVVHPMKPTLIRRARRARQAVSITRASVGFPESTYRELERLATAKKVSLAWIVREAAEKYVADEDARRESVNEGRQ